MEDLRQTFEQAEQAYNQGDYNKAISLFEKTLEIKSDFAPSYYYLGLTHKAIGTNLREVSWLFKKAVEIKPDYVYALDNLGKIYYQLGEFQKAIEVLEKAVEVEPKQFSAHLTLGWTYLLGVSQPADAISHFEKVLEEKQVPYAYFGLGMAYFMDNQRFRVLEMITALRQLNEEDFAVQLEEMVRQGHYIPPKEGAGVALLASPQQDHIVVIENNVEEVNEEEERYKEMKVRLSEPLLEKPDQSISQRTDISGADRIRAMRRSE